MDLQKSQPIKHVLIGMLASSLIVIFALFIIYLLISFGVIKYPSSKQTKTATKSAVELQTQYQNPFEKKNQYQNPFSQYKNPFDNLR